MEKYQFIQIMPILNILMVGINGILDSLYYIL